MAIIAPSAHGAFRRVLLVIEDAALSDVLAESLVDAGHALAQADSVAAAESALAGQAFDAVIVDLDTRARDGVAFIARLRLAVPSLTVIALLPCGGLVGDTTPPPYHLAIEKPARLAAVLCAVNVAPATAQH